MRPEHTDVVADGGRCNREPMRGGGVQTNRRRRRGLHRGVGFFQVPGKYIGMVRQRLAGGPSEFWESPPGLDPDGEAATEVGGGATSVHHVLSGGGPDSPPFWGGYLGFVGGDVQEVGGDTFEVPKADNGTEGSATEGRVLAVFGSIEGP